MSAADTFNVMQGGDFRILRWIEIEGLPYCYGTGPGSIGSSFFNDRAELSLRFEGIRCWLSAPPPVEDVELDVLDAFPKNAGAIQAEIVDVDGSVTTLANTSPGNARLSTDCTKLASTIVYSGTDPGFPAANGIAYIGNETITYTSHNAGTRTLTGCARGRYRSIARDWGQGIPIHVKPYTMAKRRIWYFTVASAGDPASSFFGFSDAARWLRFAGTLESFRANEQLTGYEIKGTSLEKDLDRAVFSTLRQFEGPPGAKIRGIGDTEGIDVGGTWSTPGTSSKLRTNELVAVRCDDEIMLVRRVASTEFLAIIARGLLNTPIEKHNSNATMREVVIVCPGQSGDHTALVPSTYPETSASYFWSYPTAGGSSSLGGTWFPADHPLAVLLCVMLSGHDLGVNDTDGNGWVLPGGRSFDVGPYAPKEWFLGIDATRLDLRAICQLANETAWLRVNGVIEESINFIEWAKTLLQPFGFYVTYTATGLFTIRPLRPPLPTADLRPLTDANRIRSSRPGYDSNLSAIVSSVEYRYGWDVAEGRFRRIVSLRVNEGDLYSGGRGRAIVQSSKLIYTGRERIPGELSRRIGFDVNELLQQRGDFYQARFARPPAILIETVKLDLIDVALGDLISVDSANSPNPRGGTRGLSQAIAEVIGRRIDEVEKTIELTLLLTGFEVGDYRVIGPSATVNGSGSSNVIPIRLDAPGTLLGGREGWVDYTGGDSPIQGTIAGNLIAFFPTDSVVRTYANVGTAAEPRYDFNGVAYTANVIAFDPDPGGPSITLDVSIVFDDGDLVCLDGFAFQAAAICGNRAYPPGAPGQIFTTSIFAFLAANDGLLGGTEPGHRFFPA